MNEIAAASGLPNDDALGWAERICAAWRSSVAGILETGRLLAEAKQALEHGRFELMIERELPFGARTAQRLMAIGRDERLVNTTHAPLLPPSWYTLYEISRLDDATFAAKIADGTINPEAQRKDIARESRLISRARDEARVLSLVPISGKFKTLVVDPPWDYGWLSIAGRAQPGYATMDHEALRALDVGQWAEDNCHLYLWTTNNFVTMAVDLMAHWGFAHKTVLTWVKTRLGLGSYFRNSTEHVLFGVRGTLRTRSDSIATHFEAPVGEHSEKPGAFYEIVRAASYLPAGEGFQRQARAGFVSLFEDSTLTEAVSA